ncbi:MAG: hypothetical protein MRY79_01585 [Alphaproteobacteria bacterium]|nr:hypothetical protein [Alphaproteobacteria bacterium]
MTQTQLTSVKNSLLSPLLPGEQQVEGLGRYMDCSDNPYDLRPAVNLILDAANKLHMTLPEDQPLVVLIGKFHSISAHVELSHLVSSRLLENEESFMVSCEFPHNHWGMVAKTAICSDIPSDLYYNPSDYDEVGQAFLTGYLGFDSVEVSPVAKSNLMAFWQKNVIPAFPSDAARKQGVFDLGDQFTAAAVAKYDAPLTSEAITQAPGVAARNFAMASLGVRRAKKQGKKIILQPTGLAHLLGWEPEGCEHLESLCQAYKKAGAAVLPVFLVSSDIGLGCNVLPESAHQALPETVVIDGLANERFKGDQTGEEVFIDKIHRHSGGEIRSYDALNQRSRYQALAVEETRNVIGRYKQAQANL